MGGRGLTRCAGAGDEVKGNPRRLAWGTEKGWQQSTATKTPCSGIPSPPINGFVILSSMCFSFCISIMGIIIKSIPKDFVRSYTEVLRKEPGT